MSRELHVVGPCLECKRGWQSDGAPAGFASRDDIRLANFDNPRHECRGHVESRLASFLVGAYTNEEMMNSDTAIETRTPFRTRHESEAQWLYHLRQQAWDAYNSIDLPDRVKHLWRYTDPLAFVPGDDRRLEDARGSVYAELSDEARRAGVILMGLDSAASENSELVRDHLGAIVGPTFDKFEALNLATFSDGLLLHVPNNTVLERPIILNRTVESGLFATRFLIVVGKNAEVTIVDEYTGTVDQTGQINSVVELFAEDAARVKYVTSVNQIGRASCRERV